MSMVMRNKQLQATSTSSASSLWVYFWVNQVILFTGMGLFPILPVFAGTFGADASAAGMFLAVVYVAITIGTLISGRLAQRFGERQTYLAAGLLGVPALLLLTQAGSYWEAAIYTSLVWFAGGIGLSLNSVYLGWLVAKERRGRAFGLMALTSPLGAIVGGAAVARLSELGGYPLVFAVVGLVWMTWPLVAWFKVPHHMAAPLSDDQPKGTANAGLKVSAESARGAFIRLLAAALLAALTVSIGRMGVSMAMKLQSYTLSDISLANMAAGILTLPVAWGAGRLADRMGRKPMLLISYLLAAGGAVILSLAGDAWHFWLANGMLVAGYSLGGNMASAYAADILPAAELNQRMPLVNTTKWVAGVIGFAGSGYAMQGLGMNNAFLVAGIIALLAAGLISAPSIRLRHAQPVTDCRSEDFLAQCM